MSKLQDIQTELTTRRLERARLRVLIQLEEAAIQDLEQKLSDMEEAIAIVGVDGRARQIGPAAVAKAF